MLLWYTVEMSHVSLSPVPEIRDVVDVIFGFTKQL
jgi:hypothetical protein